MQSSIKQTARNLVNRSIGVLREKRDLRAIPTLDCEPAPLRAASATDLLSWFSSADIAERWKSDSARIAPFAIPDGTRGVNPGDRKAIYHLVSALNPERVLEVGTHIGASTVHIAAAIHDRRVSKGEPASLVSVDIHDVNDPVAKPWLNSGAGHSPRETVDALGYGAFVTFIPRPSLEFFPTCEERFDLIFLDGSHAAEVVYQEIPAALRLLRPNGVILLHDYFPGLKPLWSNGIVIPGPFLAAKRLCQEGARLKVLPLGELPWPTKLNSNVTSLALLLRDA